MTDTKLCWLDLRAAANGTLRQAIAQEALHQRIDGLVADDPADLAGLPPTVRRILVTDRERAAALPVEPRPADLVIVPGPAHERAELAAAHPEVEFGRFVEITDAATLEEACTAARTERYSVLHFRDPTKIPLEIVIAAAADATGAIVTMADDTEEAKVVYGCLELGSDGVLMAAREPGAAAELKRAAAPVTGTLELVELEVTGTAHLGMGERACVDTCSYFGTDEGILVGSHSRGMVLCVSETHPLPYMPTRPFRVNAGAIHSYTLGPNGRTSYLSDLTSGAKVLAVNVKGETRELSVGRVKIESRPLISVDAVAPDGRTVNLILQDDWHVRVLGPGGAVLNSTELKPGDRLLGHVSDADRHVGYAIDEFCREQ